MHEHCRVNHAWRGLKPRHTAGRAMRLSSSPHPPLLTPFLHPSLRHARGGHLARAGRTGLAGSLPAAELTLISPLITPSATYTGVYGRPQSSWRAAATVPPLLLRAVADAATAAAAAVFSTCVVQLVITIMTLPVF